MDFRIVLPLGRLFSHFLVIKYMSKQLQKTDWKILTCRYLWSVVIINKPSGFIDFSGTDPATLYIETSSGRQNLVNSLFNVRSPGKEERNVVSLKYRSLADCNSLSNVALRLCLSASTVLFMRD